MPELYENYQVKTTALENVAVVHLFLFLGHNSIIIVRSSVSLFSRLLILDKTFSQKKQRNYMH